MSPEDSNTMSCSKTTVLFVAVTLAIAVGFLPAQQPTGLRVKWEELTAPDFVKAVEKSSKTCIIPFGVFEKHGPHLPIGTDLLAARNLALRSAEKEYAVVFPEYYFSQIFEARHQPGTVAYSEKLIWSVLEETCDEIARNGFTKILIVNGHGGNNSFLPFFCQSQLARRRDYAVFLYQPSRDPEADEQIRKMRKTTMEQHAGEVETSNMLANRPELVKLDQAGTQSGADQARLPEIKDLYTGIWWYARFPNHYAGDATPANRQLGELVISRSVEQLVRAIRTVKSDTRVLELQKQFYDAAEKPVTTKQ
jgi:creatinine amidohydrolase